MRNSLQTILTVMLICSVALLLSMVVATFIVDLKCSVLQKKMQNKRTQKKLGVIIYAYNNEATIMQCLDELYKARLRSIETVIINNASADSTKSQIKNFLKNHPKNNVKVIHKRRFATKQHALEQAVKALNNSESVLVIEPDILLTKQLLNTIKNFLNVDNPIRPLYLPILPIVDSSYTSVAKSYLLISQQFMQKALSVFYIKWGNKSSLILYPNREINNQKPLNIPKAQLLIGNQIISPNVQCSSGYGVIFSVVWIFIATYLGYIAAILRVYEPLFYCAAILNIWLILGIASAHSLNIKQKFILGFSLPIAFPLLYSLAIIILVNSGFIKARDTIRTLA